MTPIEKDDKTQVNAVHYTVLRKTAELDRLAGLCACRSVLQEMLATVPGRAASFDHFPARFRASARDMVEAELHRSQTYGTLLSLVQLIADLAGDHQALRTNLADEDIDYPSAVTAWEEELKRFSAVSGPIDAALREGTQTVCLTDYVARAIPFRPRADSDGALAADVTPDPLNIERENLRLECVEKDLEVKAAFGYRRNRPYLRIGLTAATASVFVFVCLGAFLTGWVVPAIAILTAATVAVGKVVVRQSPPDLAPETVRAYEAMTAETRERVINLHDRLIQRELILRDGRVASRLLEEWQLRPFGCALRQCHPAPLLRHFDTQWAAYAPREDAAADHAAPTTAVVRGAYLTHLDAGESHLLGQELAQLLTTSRIKEPAEFHRRVRGNFATAIRNAAADLSGEKVQSVLQDAVMLGLGGSYSLIEIMRVVATDGDACAAIGGRIGLLAAAACGVFQHSQSARLDPSNFRAGDLSLGYPIAPPPSEFVDMLKSLLSPLPAFFVSSSPDVIEFLYAGINMPLHHSRDHEFGRQVIAGMSDPRQVDRLWRYPVQLRTQPSTGNPSTVSDVQP